MKGSALITWASSWIWYAFAELCAKDGINLVLVARDSKRLQEIKEVFESTYNINVYVLAKDLSQESAPREVYEFTTSNGVRIEYLINNAWFWDYWAFCESDLEKNSQMIQLNILALTNLTRYYLTDMQKNVGKKAFYLQRLNLLKE